MKAVMTIEHGATPTEWLVTWALPTDDAGQHINVRMAVPFAHPSPRVSDLERAALEQVVAVLTGTLAYMPDRQDK